MVDGIVRQHDGRVELESTPGVGSAFHVYLRATDALAEPIPLPVETVGGTGMILVAEDETMVRAVVCRVLRQAGYEIHEACDGREALTVFEANALRIDLVLADVMMPRLTGRELYDALAVTWPDVRFLFTSGYSAELLGDGMLDRKGVERLRKPYRIDVLLARVREVLARRR